jgi:GrpB-like predicted nucleotidyltransferase (UPF0157 family)
MHPSTICRSNRAQRQQHGVEVEAEPVILATASIKQGLELVNVTQPIGPYHAPGAPKVVDLRPWDARGPAAADSIVRMLQAALPGLVIEHVGSTSVPGCGGKGILDLMLLVPIGHLSEVCAVVDGMGFQRQSGGIKHPDNRPMREGSFIFDGSLFRLHVHLVPEASAEADMLRKFRDRLTANPELVALYVEEKRRLVDAQISDRSEYTQGKKAFIEKVLKLEK